MAQQKQVPQQEQPPQDADAIFAAREAILIPYGGPGTRPRP